MLMSTDIDIAPELLESVMTDCKDLMADDNSLKTIMFSLKDNPDYLQANNYAIRIGELFSKVIESNIIADKLPEGKIYYNIAKKVLEPVLGENYRQVKEVCGYVQKELNIKAGIRLKPVVPPIDQDRVDGLVDKISSYDNYDKAKWLTEDPVVNLASTL